MIPEKIVVRATGDYKPGQAVLLRFAMSRKNPYDYIVFLDEHGTANATKDELLRSFDEDRKLFGMDYCDPRQFLTGQIEAHLLSGEEVQGTLRAYDKFKSHYAYPADYLDNLKRALTINPESKCTVTVEQIR